MTFILPGDPVLPYLPGGSPDPLLYQQIVDQLGLNDPLILRFFRYIADMLTGQWGISSAIASGAPVNTLIFSRIGRSIDLILLPLIVGLVLGFLFGNLSIKFRSKLANRIIQISTLTALAIPIFVLGMLQQYVFSYQLGIFPLSGYKSVEYSAPPQITGFYILDSIFSGDLYLIPDYLYHLIMPWTFLIIAITPLITLMTRSYLLNKGDNRNVVTNTLNFGIAFGIIYTFSVLVEIVFQFSGINQMIITAFKTADYYVINALIFLSLLIFVFLMHIANLLFTGYGALKDKGKFQFTKNQINSEKNDIKEENDFKSFNEDEMESNPFSKAKMSENGEYLRKRILSPYLLIGISILVFVIIVTIAPQIFSPYTYAELNGLFSGTWQPPSSSHPLGTTEFGRDVLGRILFGISNSVIVGGQSLLIALAGGLLIGIPMNLINKRLQISSEILLIGFYLFPMSLMIMWVIFSYLAFNNLIFGVLMIPIFAQILAKTEFDLAELTKKLLIYTPLIFGFIILLYNGLGFLGLSDPSQIQLGIDIDVASNHLNDAPWAAFFPGLFLFIIIFGVFLIYAGLQKTPQEY
ncbi:MAG: ABC transporter permease subunit [Candidatus Lokiarchaeota archaeon]|nr:ABC transporter permease subunit [Candidatus Lokiarchaeota archaeon]